MSGVLIALLDTGAVGTRLDHTQRSTQSRLDVLFDQEAGLYAVVTEVKSCPRATGSLTDTTK